MSGHRSAPPSRDLPASSSFAGGRYRIERRLGQGSFGAVYEVFDTRRQIRLALKSLSRVDPAALYRFKREFRALQEVVHPNLATLYDLHAEEDAWYFTMEFVPGVDFLHYVRPGPERPRLHGSIATGPTLDGAFDETLDELPGTALGLDAAGDAHAPPLVRPRLDRLRHALAQLIRGVAALHRAGHLHRDLKHSNVRVTPEGRVVVLDFGLVTSAGPEGLDPQQSTDVVGTPAFMAPEQAWGKGYGPPADWYAVGVMLYDALTGELPFRGSAMQMLLERQNRDGPAPSARAPETPADLDALAAALLRRDPAARPTDEELLTWVPLPAEGSPDAAPPDREPVRPSAGTPFVGREAERSALRAALSQTRSGVPAVVLISGSSGLGKTALARAFLEDVRRSDPEAVLLQGRCYAQESLPYKGLDAVVDALSQHLQTLPAAQAEALLPTDVEALSQVFPVLQRVGPMQQHTQRVHRVSDEAETRRRAFGALRELLARIATRHSLVLSVDDLQWGDADSAAVLGELLAPPDAPALLLIGTYRPDEADESPLLKVLFAELRRIGDAVARVDLPLGPLPESDARQLARRVLPHLPETHVAPLLREGEGNPFFLEALLFHAAAQPGAPPEARSVRGVLQARLSQLGPVERQVLETLALAGQPLAESLLDRAIPETEPLPKALAELRALRLIHARTGPEPLLEPYHDRIREAVAESVPPARRTEVHRRLAEAWLGAASPDPEAIARHLAAAGEPARARRHYLRAADRAARALAFDHAAGLCEAARALPAPLSEAERYDLTLRRAEALRLAGRRGEAAEEFLRAADLSPDPDTRELRRLAAECDLCSGRIERGKRLMRELLAEQGVPVPRSEGATLRAAAWNYLRLKLRGFRYRPRSPEQVPADLLRQTDALWTLLKPLISVEPVFSFAIANRYMRLALRTGMADRILFGASALATIHAAMAPEGRELRRIRRLVAAASPPDPDAFLVATHHVREAIVSFFVADFPRAESESHATLDVLRQGCPGADWEQAMAHVILLSALQWLGRWRDLDAALQSQVRDAERRGDVFGAVSVLAAFGGFPGLVADRPRAAWQALDACVTRYDTHYGLLENIHLWEAIARVYVLLYTDPAAALAFVDDRWPVLKKKGVLDTVILRTELGFLRNAALIALVRGHARPAAHVPDEAHPAPQAPDPPPPDEPHPATQATNPAPPDEPHHAPQAPEPPPPHPDIVQPWTEAPAPNRTTALRRARRGIRTLHRTPLWLARILADLNAACLQAALGEADAARAQLAAVETTLTERGLETHAAAARRLRGVLTQGAAGTALVADADAALARQGVQNPARFAALFAPGAQG